MMHRFFERLRPLIRGIVTHPLSVLAVALLFTALGINLTMKLKIDTDLANLIPPDYTSSQALERLRETVGGESEASVVIESSSFEANVQFAEALIPRVFALTGKGYTEPYFNRVEFRKDTEFLKDNALYFATPAELDLLDGWLDDKIEQARLEASPFYFDLDEDEAEADSVGDQLADIYNDIVSKEYPISEDSLTMVLRFFPAQSTTDISFIEDAYRDLDRLLEETNPAQYREDMTVTTAGRLLRRLIEVQTIQKDVFSSFGSGVFAVLMMVVLYFFYKSYRARAGKTFQLRVLLTEILRMPAMALVIGLPLFMSLSWTFGLAYLQFGELNLMTSTLGLVLFGLGIDFGIHFYARYSEERAAGKSVIDAAENTFSSTGQAITIGAMTTALALFVLVLADFRGFSQFGFIAGTGILFALIAMLVVLPALLSLFEKARLLNMESGIEEHHHEPRPSGSFPAVKTILAGSVIAVIFALIMLPRVSFEYRFGELEPTYKEYEARRDIERKVYGDSRRRNPSYIVVDSPEEVQPITEALNERALADTLSPTIDRVESLQDRFPMTEEAQEARLEYIAAIREKLSDSFLELDDSEDMERLRRAATTTEALTLDEVPTFLREQFTSKTGELGNFVTIYPAVGLSDGRNSIAFSEDVGTVTTRDGKVYHAGSTSLVAADMLKLMRREAPWMVLATFVIVLGLMYGNFSTIRWTALAVLPLVVGVLWMLLMVEILSLKLNFYNLIVLPAVLGIGNDAGVHFVHRYQEEGRGSIMRVLRSTGEHIAMGSLTTMVGFGGLMLSFHPGLESIGMLAVVGIGSTLLAALLFLPALLQWLEDREEVSPEK